jgi:hypothetical protein
VSDPIGEGIAWAIGKFGIGGADMDDAAQMKERLRSGFPSQEFDRAGSSSLYREMQEGRYQELPAGEVSGSTAIDVLGRQSEIGIPSGWAARDATELANMPGNEAGVAVCAALYRPDADPGLVYSLQVLTLRGSVQEVQKNPDPALWLLRTEQQTGLRAVAPAVCVRLGAEPAYLWHLAGSMGGAAVGRPHESLVEIRSSELWCPLPDGMAKILLVAPPERVREGSRASRA